MVNYIICNRCPISSYSNFTFKVTDLWEFIFRAIKCSPLCKLISSSCLSRLSDYLSIFQVESCLCSIIYKTAITFYDYLSNYWLTCNPLSIECSCLCIRFKCAYSRKVCIYCIAICCLSPTSEDIVFLSKCILSKLYILAIFATCWLHSLTTVVTVAIIVNCKCLSSPVCCECKFVIILSCDI